MSTQHPSLNDPNAWVPYRYQPSLAAAVIFAVLFGIASGWHTWILCRRKSWYFMPFAVGCLFECVGYIGRGVSSRDIWALGPYIVQSILLLVAPALFAASIYMTLGKIIQHEGAERCCMIPLRWLTKVFVLGDCIAFLLQIGGGGIQAGGTLFLLDLGEKIIIAGLFAQLLFFGLFIIVAVHFDYRYRRLLREKLADDGWKTYMWALYGGSGLIVMRSAFRVVEYLMGNDGYLLRHEYFLYVFDALPMMLETVLFVAYHPSRLLRIQ